MMLENWNAYFDIHLPTPSLNLKLLILQLCETVIIHILESKLMSESGNLQSISNEHVKVIANFVKEMEMQDNKLVR